MKSSGRRRSQGKSGSDRAAVFTAWARLGWALLTLVLASPPDLKAEEMQYPVALVAAEDGSVYIADRNLPGIWRIADGRAEVWFRGSKTFRTPLNAIRSLAIDQKGRLLAGDSATREVYRIDEGRLPTPLTNGSIGIPVALAVSRQGVIYVADLEAQRIWKLTEDGRPPIALAEVPAPRGLAIDDQDRLWIVSHGSDQLLRMNAAGRPEVVVEGRPFKFPHQIVLGPKNSAYVADGFAKAVWKVDSDGGVSMVVSGKPLVNPVGLYRRQDNLLVADPQAKAIFEVDPAGKVSIFYSSRPEAGD